MVSFQAQPRQRHRSQKVSPGQRHGVGHYYVLPMPQCRLFSDLAWSELLLFERLTSEAHDSMCVFLSQHSPKMISVKIILRAFEIQNENHHDLYLNDFIRVSRFHFRKNKIGQRKPEIPLLCGLRTDHDDISRIHHFSDLLANELDAK